MKKMLLPVALIAPLVSTIARADDPVAHPLVAVSVTAVYAPDGFDDNDDSQVVVDGYLPSTCYRTSDSVASLDRDTGVITVTQYARKFGGPCIQAKIPFFSEVKLGVLPVAHYQVAASGARPENLNIKEALNGGPDDFLYAPVDWAHVAYDGATRRYVATIAGRLTSSCMQWDDVKVVDQGRVLVLLPILKPFGSNTCQSKETAYQRQVTLPADMLTGRHLLHVRSLNGKAANTMFTVGPRVPVVDDNRQ